MKKTLYLASLAAISAMMLSSAHAASVQNWHETCSLYLANGETYEHWDTATATPQAGYTLQSVFVRTPSGVRNTQATIGKISMVDGLSLTVADQNGGTFNPLNITKIEIEEGTTSTIAINAGQSVVIGAVSGGSAKYDVSGTLTLQPLRAGDSMTVKSGASLLVDGTMTMEKGSTLILGQTANIDFGKTGKLVSNNDENNLTDHKSGGFAITLSAEIELDLSAGFKIESRDLIAAKDIWWRDGASCVFDYNNSTIKETNGITLLYAGLAEDANADWVIDGKTYTASEVASLGSAYRFVATKAGGISIQYITAPEPATATLSLLALAGLCARRRRK